MAAAVKHSIYNFPDLSGLFEYGKVTTFEGCLAIENIPDAVGHCPARAHEFLFGALKNIFDAALRPRFLAVGPVASRGDGGFWMDITDYHSREAHRRLEVHFDDPVDVTCTLHPHLPKEFKADVERKLRIGSGYLYLLMCPQGKVVPIDEETSAKQVFLQVFGILTDIQNGDEKDFTLTWKIHDGRTYTILGPFASDCVIQKAVAESSSRV